MTTHQSSTVSPILGWEPTTTPIAVAPIPAEPPRYDLTVTIGARITTSGALERDPQAQWIGRLRRIAAEKLTHLGLGRLRADAEVLVSELVTNALRYGEGPSVGVRLVITGRGIVIVVHDGSGVTPQVKAVGDDQESGRGLLLIATLATDWGVTPDRTTTWCVLNLPEAAS
ncbi:ATP-binding protein [Streptomyces sp. NPDC058171]